MTVLVWVLIAACFGLLGLALAVASVVPVFASSAVAVLAALAIRARERVA